MPKERKYYQRRNLSSTRIKSSENVGSWFGAKKSWWYLEKLPLSARGIFLPHIRGERLTRAGPGRSWPVLAGPGRSTKQIMSHNFPKKLFQKFWGEAHERAYALSCAFRLKKSSWGAEHSFFWGPKVVDRPGPALVSVPEKSRKKSLQKCQAGKEHQFLSQRKRKMLR